MSPPRRQPRPRAASAPVWALLSAGAGACARPEPLAPRTLRALEAGVLELQRVSLSASSEQLETCTATRPPCKNSSHPTISYDGTRVAFDCDASEVVPGFPNPKHSAQVYLRDLAAGSTVLVSVAADAAGNAVLPDAPAGFPEISADGRWIAFASAASDLDPDDGDAQGDVFLARVSPPSIERLSENPGGADLDGASGEPVLSGDAASVAFSSRATDFALLVRPGHPPSGSRPSGKLENVFVLERGSGRFLWLGLRPDGGEPGGAASQPVIDLRGRRIAFTSAAADLLPGDRNGEDLDVFACDVATGAVTCVSADWRGSVGGDATSRKPALSGDGRYVAFESNATDLLPPGEDTNAHSDVFVRDLERRSTLRVSVSSFGQQANGQSGYSACSHDGRFVAFTSFARNLVAGDTTRGFPDFFVRDRDASGDGRFDEPRDVRTVRLSVTPDGVQSNARCGGNCDVSGDGEFAAFMSEADNLAHGDTNGAAAGMACSPTCPFGRDVLRVRIHD